MRDFVSHVAYSGSFNNYHSGDYPSVVRQGRFVYLEGVMTPTKTIESTNDGTLAFTVPEGFRPRRKAFAICQGSSSFRWLLIVDQDGAAYAARYSDGSYSSFGPNTFMPFSAVWTTEDEPPE